jgi:anion-transporting  ArsA/GET3 family ATPase
MARLERPLTIVVGAGGVGKTTLAAALSVVAASEGARTLVMTFDPSLRLKTALGVGDEAREREVPVALPEGAAGALAVHLLDARRTFDRLVARYSPDEAAAARILTNRFYDQLSGSLAGVFEYMAVERLFEASREGRYDRLFLDTPPTRQALDFLEAPDRILAFLDSGALKVALKPWFDASGRLSPTRGWGPLGRAAERFLDDIVGIDFLRDMAEFFQAFAPLYEGFRERAEEVRRLLRSAACEFVLVTEANPERVPDALFFARRLAEREHRLAAVVVNRVHPQLVSTATEPALEPGRRLLAWLGEHDRRGLAELADLLGAAVPLVSLELEGREPISVEALARFGRTAQARLATAAPV